MTTVFAPPVCTILCWFINAIPYDIPRGNVAAYFPEANPLVPIASVAKVTNTPTSKYVVVTVVASEAAKRERQAKPEAVEA